ncbi:hypothetical protein PputUW4_04161 [Pseudomonas sp. UW4]|nr:hypothetical protein PputUW4_04161 [Pseudomonas sp. UW4]
MLAMVVNDNVGELDKRGALESIASRLAPTVSVHRQQAGSYSFSVGMAPCGSWLASDGR